MDAGRAILRSGSGEEFWMFFINARAPNVESCGHAGSRREPRQRNSQRQRRLVLVTGLDVLKCLPYLPDFLPL